MFAMTTQTILKWLMTISHCALLGDFIEIFIFYITLTVSGAELGIVHYNRYATSEKFYVLALKKHAKASVSDVVLPNFNK